MLRLLFPQDEQIDQPATYRELASAVTPEGIEIDGETVPLAPENALRIRAFIHHLRARLKRAEDTTESYTSPRITALVSRADALFDDVQHAANRPLADAGDKAALRGFINYSINRLNRIAKSMPE